MSTIQKCRFSAEFLGHKNHPPRTFIYYEGEEYETLRGQNKQPERVKVADFLAIADKDDTIMRVVYAEGKPITNIAGPGGYQKTLKGIDMVEF
jgi:hypothetical protein